MAAQSSHRLTFYRHSRLGNSPADSAPRKNHGLQTSSSDGKDETRLAASTSAAGDDVDPFGDDSSVVGEDEDNRPNGEDDEDAQSIRSAISSMSLADNGIAPIQYCFAAVNRTTHHLRLQFLTI